MSALAQSIASTLGAAGSGYGAARDAQTEEKNQIDQVNAERAFRLKQFLVSQRATDLQNQVAQARLAIERQKPVAPPKSSWRVEMSADGKPHDILYDDVSGRPIHDAGVHYEPPKTAPAERTAWKVDMIGGVPHDVLYDSQGNLVKVGGVHYERPDKTTKSGLTPAQASTQFNQLVTTFKFHLSQAQTAMDQANSQKSAHPFISRLGMLGTDPVESKAARDRAARALAYVLSQREGILKGDKDMQDVSNQAQSIKDGTDQLSPTPSTPSGAVPIPSGAKVGG